jgi:hypothetical protein
MSDISVTVSVTDATGAEAMATVGGIITTTIGGGDPFAPQDGSLTPGGSIPYPNYFTTLFPNAYPHRPPWKVAGVDYGIGPRSSVTLQPWTTICPLNGTNGNWSDQVEGTAVLRYLGGSSGLNLSGIDFNNPSPRLCHINGTTGTILISDCNFVATNPNNSNSLWMQNLTGPITLQYCKAFGAGNVNLQEDTVKFDGTSGAHTISYCWIGNSAQQNCHYAPSSGTLLAQFTLFEEAGLGAFQPLTPHGDFIFIQGGSASSLLLTQLQASYCVLKQLTSGATAGTDGVQFQFNGAGNPSNVPLLSNVTFNNNTGACNPSGSPLGEYFYTGTNQTQTPPNILISQNYIDSGSLGTPAHWHLDAPANQPNGNPTNGQITVTGNIDLVTGAVLT